MNNYGTAKQKAVLRKEKKISEDHCDYLTSLVVDIVKSGPTFRVPIIRQVFLAWKITGNRHEVLENMTLWLHRNSYMAK